MSWGRLFQRLGTKVSVTELVRPVEALELYGFCGRKATLNHAHALVTVCP